MSVERGEMGAVAEAAMRHCMAAASVAAGECARTGDGHLVRRLSAETWVVVDSPAWSSYREGGEVKGGVLFWRMGGVLTRLALVVEA